MVPTTTATTTAAATCSTDFVCHPFSGILDTLTDMVSRHFVDYKARLERACDLFILSSRCDGTCSSTCRFLLLWDVSLRMRVSDGDVLDSCGDRLIIKGLNSEDFVPSESVNLDERRSDMAMCEDVQIGFVLAAFLVIVTLVAFVSYRIQVSFNSC